MSRVFEAMAHVLQPNGKVALVTEDGDETVALAEQAGFSLLAEVVQGRPAGRREHVQFYISRKR